MIRIKPLNLLDSLDNIGDGNRLRINTINAHSYNIARKDKLFSESLLCSEYLIPDGQSVVWAKNFLNGEKLKRIAGADLFSWEMKRVNAIGGKCFFLGSTESTLSKIISKAQIEYPNIVIETFSPPYKPEFSDEENQEMISKVNQFKPDVLFVGMTAPKQEKWVHTNVNDIEAKHICSIGAVFDFYAGNIKRAPQSWQDLGLEWLYRLIKEPKRMWRRYVLGNVQFIFYVFKEKII